IAAIVKEAPELGVYRVPRFFRNHHAFRIQPAPGELHLAFHERLFAGELVALRHDRQGFRNAARHHGRSGFPVLLHRARWGHLWLRRLLEPHGGGHGLVITDGDLDRAFRAHNALAHLRAGRIEIRQVSVGADGAVADLLAFRVLVDELYVVVDVTPVLANVQPANTDDVFGP